MGTVIVLTFGTGIGSATPHDGRLIPNVELGQIELRGIQPAGELYSAKAMTDRGSRPGRSGGSGPTSS